MASLILTIGQLTATVTANNAKASALLEQYAASLGATGTNQQKADAVVRGLVQHMREQAQRQRANVAQIEAMATIQTEMDALDWSD